MTTAETGRRPRQLKIRLAIATAATAAIMATVAILFTLTAGHQPELRRPQQAAVTAFVQRDIVVNGLRLRYIDEGSGPPLLLIPGLASRVEEFEDLTRDLRQRFRVLSFDFPGSGYSDKPDRDYDLVFYEDTAIAFLDALKIGECYLAGGSLGGNLVLRLGHRLPQRFTRLAAWGPGSAWPAKPGLAAFMRLAGGRLAFWPTLKIQSTYWHDPSWPGREASLKEAFTYFDEVVSPQFIRMYWGIAADQIGSSLFDIAPDIGQPTLLLVGENDHGLGMYDGVLRLSSLLPHSRLLVFKGAGHAVSSERPQEISRALAEFFSEQP
jgi:pimeloyl-ACP methyl ester carboxylesterase